MNQQLQIELLDRLGELRRRLVSSAVVLVLATIAAYAVSQDILRALIAQHPDLVVLIFLSPAEAFFSRLKLALAAGFIVILPFLLFQVWGFFSPFLNRKDRIWAFLLIPVSFLLFAAGAALAYLGILPIALHFFLSFGSADLEPMISVAPYVSFVIALVLPMGVIFELPVVILFLAKLGIVDPHKLAANRKYAILIIVVLGAILTPADAFSQLMMAGPVIILFELSVLIARIFWRRK